MKSFGYKLKIQSWLMVGFVCCATYSAAAPILAVWEDGETYEFSDWAASLRHTDDGGAPGAAEHSISGDAGVGTEVGGNLNALLFSGDPTSAGEALFYTSGFGTVNLNNYAGIGFDFYAGDDYVSDIGVYFQSSVDGSVWYYTIEDPTVGSWASYHAPLDYSLDWLGYSLSDGTYSLITDDISTAFGVALAGANQLGVFISYAAEPVGNQLYGIDNFGLTVPEPETYMALGVALLGMAFIFRKRVSESLDEARAVMQM
jgi:hypothetical protein